MYNVNRLKVQLKLCVNRLEMLQTKKTAMNQKVKKEISELIETGKLESAKIRTEQLIRQDMIIEAMEILKVYCELISARFGLLEAYKTCEASISEAVNTLVWAAPRLSDIKELGLIKDQLASKFGKEFAANAIENKDQVVNSRIIIKLQADVLDSYLVERYLEEIAGEK